MPWLTPFLFKQGPRESLSDLPLFYVGPRGVGFVHIVHAYVDHATPRNTEVQTLTFETMRTAMGSSPGLNVSPVIVTFPDERDLVPSDLIAAPALSRSVGDLYSFRKPRRLPLLFDVLDAGIDAHRRHTARGAFDDDFVVLTNSDIHLLPGFYSAVAELVGAGYDVITINRRTISSTWLTTANLSLMACDYGEDHEGFDCFVFPMRLVPRLVESDCCIGAGAVMRSLLFNLVVAASRFAMLTRAHLTFHIGDDQHWKKPEFSDYIEFNVREAVRVAKTLAATPANHARLTDFCLAHEKNPAYLKALSEMER
jgi:hypothetical protein